MSLHPLAELSPVVDELDARQLRAALQVAGWVPGAVAEHLGDDIAAALTRAEPAPVLAAFDTRDLCSAPFGVLTRLFGLHLPVRTDLVADALPLDAAIRFGVIETVGEYCRAPLQVQPFDRPGWWVVSDWAAPVERGPLPDAHVLGYSGASQTLATITPRLAGGIAADIGTGSGVQALLLSDHVDRVVATDIDDRALALALRTFTLCDVDVELRKGSLFEPLGQQKFDVIVSNPPFVIGRHGSVFRDAGFDDDNLGRLLVGDVARHLTDSGVAVFLLNWLHKSDVDWRDHVAEWIGAEPVTAWFAQRQVLDPAAYASAWLTDLGLDPRSHAGDQRRWIDALAAAETRAVGMGWVAIRPAAETLVVAEDVSAAPRLPNGEEVLDALDLAAFSTIDAFATLACTPRVAPGTRLFRANTLGGVIGATPPLLGVIDSWRGDVVVDDLVAHIAEHADGATSVADLIDAAASDFDLDPDDVLGAVLAPVRGLLQTGVFLVNVSL